jgi:transposase
MIAKPILFVKRAGSLLDGGRRMRRHELTDRQWRTIAHLFPPNRKKRGGQWKDHRTVLNGMFWWLRTGAPWRDLPERFGPWQTVYDRLVRYRTDGTLDKIIQLLQVKLDRKGKIDWELWCIDGTNIRASRAAAGGGKKGATKSPPTTRWAAREADSAASSTWLLTAEAFPWPSKSPRARPTSPRRSKR